MKRVVLVKNNQRTIDDLPKDVINLLMTQYFYPFTALKCLEVSKKFFNAVNPTDIRYRAVRYGVFCRDHHRTDKLILCPQCNCLLNKKNYEKHLEKHAKNPDMQYHHTYSEECNDCGMKFPPTNHDMICPLKLANCYETNIYGSWGIEFKRLCDPSIKMPRQRLLIHTCRFQCITCKEIIEALNPYVRSAFYDHMDKKHSSRHSYTMNGQLLLFVGCITLVLGYHWWG